MSRVPARVLIADDHPVYREGLASALRRRAELKLVAEAGDGREALSALRRLDPDVAVIDLQLPELDGMAVLDTLQREHRRTRCVVLSAYHDSGRVFSSVSAGARADLVKTAPSEAIADAVVAVARGETVFPPEIQAALAGEIRMRRDLAERPLLSPRELEVLRLAADGLTGAEIAANLHVSAATVKAHFQHVYEKLEVSDRAAAVACAIRRGLLE
jgi:two-component system nitrate/nitrite response regulator NarL